MSRRRKAAVALASAMAIGATCELAHSQPTEPPRPDVASAPPYTLEVETDAPEVVSFEALAARIGADLGAKVVRPGATPASRAAISIRYRDRELVVRATHSGGRVVERTVKAEGDDAAVQREAVLLASNLARDEASELLDALAARRAPSEPKTSTEPGPSTEQGPPPTPSKARAPDEGHHPITVAIVYPLATNSGRPNAESNVHLSLVYGRVGTLSGVALGGAVLYASRKTAGAQIGGAASISAGSAAGVQVAGAVNYAGGEVAGVQVAGATNIATSKVAGASVTGAFNFAGGGLSGAQISGGLNLSRGDTSGAQVSGGANIATRSFEGAQIASVNVAENVAGAQIGVINIARKVKGTQIGVINIAEEVDGAALGVISVSKGGIHPIAWASNLQYMNAGIKFATKHTYTIAAVHYGTLEGEFGNIGTTAAVGGHIPLPARFDIEVQGMVTHLIPRPSQSTKSGNVWFAPQAIAGYSFASHLRVFAGAGVRLPVSVDLGRDVRRPEILAGVQF
ncbi:MAG TPA: hypothetical protein VM580_18640 [Labilithrix sp.]|nr:hypothetical protein [Labilithrix sp.]